MTNQTFETEYKRLNEKQKEAVDTIDGPVMVVAGPGTGKTQVLALRIANILQKTDTKADGILCLTFTNSGVHAMRKRLFSIIGPDALRIGVYTFHSFAQKIIEQYFNVLGLTTAPSLLDDESSVLLYDELLENNTWEYITPRNNKSEHFSDIKSLINLFKRENISPLDAKVQIENEIQRLKDDPESLSTRGETKGMIKKEVESKIESMSRTREAIVFYGMYEELKKDKNMMDYDDVLLYLIEIVKESDDARSQIKEDYYYVHVDEHQDSSGIQNQFLSIVWKDVEKPNIFVVGDDRQLIYAFGGADISYFENFKSEFGRAHLITLTENYRSGQKILDTADILLSSSIANGKLKSNHKHNNDVLLYHCNFERDEYILASKIFKEKIKDGVDMSQYALLVPKNSQVRNAIQILKDNGLSIANNDKVSFFDDRIANIFKSFLHVYADPYDQVSIVDMIFSPYSSIKNIDAHQFFFETKTRNLSLFDLINYKLEIKNNQSLFIDDNPIRVLGVKMQSYIDNFDTHDIYSLIQHIGADLFLNNVSTHEELVHNTEVVRTYLHLCTSYIERNTNADMKGFLSYLQRLESYHHHIPLASVESSNGIKVMTLHASKGLEFDVVHIAHTTEQSLLKGRKKAFTLPEQLNEKVKVKDELDAKRELYVAITRAREYCSMSYADQTITNAPVQIAHIVEEIPHTHLIRIDEDKTREIIEKDGVEAYTKMNDKKKDGISINDLADIVKEQYTDRNVSVTLLNNFFECPYKWYFNNFLQLPSPKTESLILGSVVHSCIEQILKDKIKNKDLNDNKNKILDNLIYEKIKKELIFEENLVNKLALSVRSILLNWINNYYPNILSTYMTERSVSFIDKQFPHLKMYGKIDLSEDTPEGLIITDFKTGSSKTKGVIEKIDENGKQSSHLRQLAMYSYLVEGNSKMQNVALSRLLYLEEDPKNKNAIYGTHITNEDIDLLIRDIREYDESLSSGSWITRPCLFKPYGTETPTCPYCKKIKEVYKF